MKLLFSSPTKDFIGQKLFGIYSFISKSVARTAPIAVFPVCVFLVCASLTAQQTETGANAHSVALFRTASVPASLGAETASSQDSIGESSNAFDAMAASGGSTSTAVYGDFDSQAAQKNLPNAPTAQGQAEDQPAPQTKRILGIIPNFRAVSTDVKLPPQSVKDKFMDATQDSFDYSSILIPGMLAAYSMGTNATPEFHEGAAGYARYFWHAAVDQTSENYMVEFIVPVITHQDTRYYTLGRGGFLKRTGYALTRSVITRSDSGKEEFNISEVVGAGAAAGLSSLYYPGRERSIGNTGKEWGLDVGIDAVSYVVREFWPDINHKLFHGAKPSAVIQGEQKSE
jgi:hypothetical protein